MKSLGEYSNVHTDSVMCGEVLVWADTSSDAIHFIYFAYSNLRGSILGGEEF